MTRRGIETAYCGVRFRSRLEARWAAMFDELGWRWEYEPIDLSGHIPDFVLRFPAGPVLVEVKPEFTVDALIAAASRKIDAAGWRSENPSDALILGATWNPDHRYSIVAGALRRHEQHDGRRRRAWDAGVWHWCGTCERPSLCYLTGFRRMLAGELDADAVSRRECVRCGAQVGSYSGDVEELSLGVLEGRWRMVGDEVRWKAGR
jgi:hypothetical protein